MKNHKFFIILVTILAVGCKGQNNSKAFDYGKVENMKYVNSYFDFNMDIPTDWKVQSREQLTNLTKTGANLVAGDDSKMKAMLKASEVNTAPLLAVYQYELGAAVDYNPGFVIMAENIKNFPGIKTGSEYLYQVKKLLQQSQFKYDYVDTVFVKEEIDGTDFYKMNAELSLMGMRVQQIYYSTILKGFSFNIIISYANENQKEDLLKSLKTMKFQK